MDSYIVLLQIFISISVRFPVNADNLTVEMDSLAADAARLTVEMA